MNSDRARMPGAARGRTMAEAAPGIGAAGETASLQDTQSAVLNILEDSMDEAARLRDTQRAVLNILEDLGEEKEKVQRANEELERARDIVEASLERTRYALDKEHEAVRRLEELDQLKNEFVGMVAHDIRSPMATIGGFASTLLQRWESFDDAQKLQFLQIIDRNVGEMDKLVTNILDVSRIESGAVGFDTKPFDLPDLVRRVASEMATAAHRSCAVNAPGGLPLAVGDEQRQRQILANLITNAFKFSPDGSPVEISVRNRGGMLEVQVRDHGIGIPRDATPKLFKKFSRIPDPDGQRRSGSGLGLYLCKSFVEAQGGTIGLESTPGEGSAFTYTVPTAGSMQLPFGGAVDRRRGSRAV